MIRAAWQDFCCGAALGLNLAMRWDLATTRGWRNHEYLGTSGDSARGLTPPSRSSNYLYKLIITTQRPCQSRSLLVRAGDDQSSGGRATGGPQAANDAVTQRQPAVQRGLRVLSARGWALNRRGLRHWTRPGGSLRSPSLRPTLTRTVSLAGVVCYVFPDINNCHG